MHYGKTENRANFLTKKPKLKLILKRRFKLYIFVFTM